MTDETYNGPERRRDHRQRRLFDLAQRQLKLTSTIQDTVQRLDANFREQRAEIYALRSERSALLQLQRKLRDLLQSSDDVHFRTAAALALDEYDRRAALIDTASDVMRRSLEVL